MSKSYNKNDKKTMMRGRRVSTWKVVLLSLLVLLVVCTASIYVFLETYVPNVDDDPHFARLDTSDAFSLASNTSMRKYNIARALKDFGSAVTGQLENATFDLVRVDGIYNFLVLGHDKVALNTDVIMIVSFDTNDGSISVMQLPRDTYIEHDGYAHKINSMFAYLVGRARQSGSKNVYHDALASYCDLLENALSIELDNYALINLDAFENIVDIIGGVPIYVPDDMHYDDEVQGLSIHINKGQQVLDGETAAGFVRFRSGYINADIGRQDAQKLFMTAFLDQVKNTISVTTVTKIVDQVIKNITTDLSAPDAAYYAKSALSVDLGNLNMITLPGKSIYSGGVSYYVIYRQSAIDIINGYFNVYNRDIRDEMFDRDLLFTDLRSNSINSIYYSENTDYRVNNGESLNEDGIYIPRLPDIPVSEVTNEAETSSYSEATDELSSESESEDELKSEFESEFESDTEFTYEIDTFEQSDELDTENIGLTDGTEQTESDETEQTE